MTTSKAPHSFQAWLLISLDNDARQHAGNLGYRDEVESVYRCDSLVPNARQLRAGHIAVLRSNALIGIAEIKHIDESDGVKILLRCPSCKRTSIKRRRHLTPRYRCSKCKAEFDDPKREPVKVRTFEVHFENTFIPTPDGASLKALRDACPFYNGQLAIQHLELGGWVSELQRRFPAVAALLNPDQADAFQRSARQLELAAQSIDITDSFQPIGPFEGRSTQLRAIAVRRGQPRFRNQLLDAYGSRCAVSGCDVEEALEAAHILPFDGENTNYPQNGLLLRSDIHLLFDRGLLGFDPITWTVVIHDRLAGSSFEYLAGVRLSLPANPTCWPSIEALSLRRAELGP